LFFDVLGEKTDPRELNVAHIAGLELEGERKILNLKMAQVV